MASAIDVADVETPQHFSNENHVPKDSVEGQGMELSLVPDEHDLGLYPEGVEFPMDEEIATLRRVSDKMPVGAFAIVIVELCERFAYYGAPCHNTRRLFSC